MASYLSLRKHFFDRHVKSKKFLTVSYFQLAEQEKENMKVTVEV